MEEFDRCGECHRIKTPNEGRLIAMKQYAKLFKVPADIKALEDWELEWVCYKCVPKREEEE